MRPISRTVHPCWFNDDLRKEVKRLTEQVNELYDTNLTKHEVKELREMTEKLDEAHELRETILDTVVGRRRDKYYYTSESEMTALADRLNELCDKLTNTADNLSTLSDTLVEKGVIESDDLPYSLQ
ncbi:unnamed protein product [Vitrella brassicaformis CCMP3155]|uniref:Uncharacterized protein n=2 Tax=Vitrella brassicaformis TaxID=1169539 RepID=A0A0G4EAT6_VITBC|nr:unnamed protein product [Vitrella brassicaformis CCMP3155]|mmetsp:Transcript_1495/g.3246  ORF Transcript_1495/g.3246 Transcript_1495/m.3246 type:complete len:126 (+) Transcript_1495:365-742(+)|eukprot:CEL92413.1 unnamed protein product [Vitrella brassicaformis CCMP3155]